MSDELYYRWRGQPAMEPLPRDHFLDYWTRMPNPLTPKQADDAFRRLTRSGALLAVGEAEMLAAVIG